MDPDKPSTEEEEDYMQHMSFADVMQFADFGTKSRGTRSDDLDDIEYWPDDKDVDSMSGLPPVPVDDMNMKSMGEVKSRRKRARTMKTTEEVESQRMTHIAVERNRRRQMNDHLRVLRSLMPGSYVQRGDQASIIGGAIEFVRELEQLLQCLESQKRRRLYGTNEPPLPPPPQQQPPSLLAPVLPISAATIEDTAENKSCLGDIEVRLLGPDAMIKILSRRRPGQLVRLIAALEELQFGIIHTNVTTIEQTVLYSFNVKIGEGTECTADDVAASVQQILGFIDTNTI